MGRPYPTRSAPAALTSPPEHDPRGLVRQLIRACQQGSATEESAEPGGAVLLDLCLDDYRCVLIYQRRLGTAERPELSPREQEIARMVAKGFPNKMIARVLEISTWTVGTYLRRIFAKLGVTSRAAMVARLSEANVL